MSAQDARDRFAAATREHLSAPLTAGASGDITLRHVDGKTWHEVIEPLWQESLERPGLDVQRALLDDAQRARLADLDAVMERLEHRVLFERVRNDGGTELVGGYWGSQDSEGRYAMVVSVFAAAYRGKGLYSAWLPRVVEAARASGFREMYSRHRADNNPILVPKLKAGFVIAGFEVAPRWGLCIWLRKYLVDAFEQVHAFRIDGTHGDTLRARGLPVP